jgi:hypothetical protein
LGYEHEGIVTQQDREAAFVAASSRRLDCMREVYDTFVQTSFVDFHVSCRYLDEAGQCRRCLHVG